MPRPFQIQVASLGPPTTRTSVVVITALIAHETGFVTGEYYLLKQEKAKRVEGHRLTFDARSAGLQIALVNPSHIEEELQRQAAIEVGDYLLKRQFSGEPQLLPTTAIDYSTPRLIPLTCELLRQYPEEVAFIHSTTECKELREHFVGCGKIAYQKKAIFRLERE